MKNYQKIIILIFVVFGGVFFYIKKSQDIKSGAINILKKANFLSVCNKTLYYSIGEIDPRFEISKEEVLAIVTESENVWEENIGKNVFEYREGANFKISFIFDERQEGTLKKMELDKEMDKLVENKNNLSEEYQKLESAYQKRDKSYKINISAYEKRLENFNEKVEKWNEGDNSSKDEYDELKKEEKELKKQKESLETERQAINKLIAQLNNLANKESGMVENFNEKVKTYQEKFGESREFNQGEYNSLGINIYQFYEKVDLKLVLVHELGHALGIDHVTNPQSVMYYLMEKQNLENINLTAEDLGAIKNICNLE